MHSIEHGDTASFQATTAVKRHQYVIECVDRPFFTVFRWIDIEVNAVSAVVNNRAVVDLEVPTSVAGARPDPIQTVVGDDTLGHSQITVPPHLNPAGVVVRNFRPIQLHGAHKYIDSYAVVIGNDTTVQLQPGAQFR